MTVMESLGAFVFRRRVWLIALCLAATAPCLFLVPRLDLDANTTNLFPAGDPRVADLMYFSSNFGISDTVGAVVRAGEADESVRVAEERLRGSALITLVERRVLPDGRTLLLAYPREPAMNQAFSRRLIAEVRSILRESGVSAELTGAPVVLAESRESLRKDIARSGSVSVLLVAALVLVLIGDLLFPLLAFLPLALGVAWSLAFAQVMFGRVNILTAGLSTTLVGIGIDYAVHCRTAWVEDGAEDSAEAWGRVFGRIGTPMVIAALTTLLAYLALLPAAMRGIGQMGLVGAGGLAMMVLMTMLMLPGLLHMRRRVGLQGRALPAAWLERVSESARRRRGWVIGAFATATALLLAPALMVRISVNPEEYENPRLPSRQLRTELARDMKMVLDPILVATPDLKAERRVVDAIRSLIGHERPFARVDCLSERLEIPGGSVQARRFIGKDKRLCMVLYPSADPYSRGHLEELVAAVGDVRLRGGADVLCISGAPLVFHHLFALIRRDFLVTGAVTGVCVAMILTLLLRRWRLVLAALLPLIGGLVWTFGVMKLAGLKMTAANVVVMPLVVGLGVDYGVYMAHGLARLPARRVAATTGRAILVAASTTAAGFATLCLARNPALSGIGLAAGVGIVSCTLWSLVFLPALMGRQEASAS